VDPDTTRAHQPPRIVIDSIPTYYLGPYITLVRTPRDACKCQLELSIPQVIEEDTSVDLDGRWFIDYQPHDPSTWGYRFSAVPGSLDFRATQRSGPSYTLDPDALGLSDGFHTVEIVLAEHGAYNDDADNPQTPNRTLFPDYEAATYRFFVKVQTDPEAAQCPQQAPFVRSCPGGGP
jgi:hypothetical protein